MGGRAPAFTKARIVTDGNVLPGGSSDLSTSLLARVQRMEPAAWVRFVQLYSPLVYTWCRRAQLQEADAEDVGQQIFLAVARTVGDFRRDRPGDTFRGWLRTIARSKIADFFRRQRRNPPAVGGHQHLDNTPDPLSLDDDPESLRADKQVLVQRALQLIRSEFADNTWRAYLMLVQEDKSPADTAAELGMTVNAVYLARVRVQRRLREQLADVF
jgi:RNA polymerase sigma-70 factor (ECF subfamily)